MQEEDSDFDGGCELDSDSDNSSDSDCKLTDVSDDEDNERPRNNARRVKDSARLPTECKAVLGLKRKRQGGADCEELIASHIKSWKRDIVPPRTLTPLQTAQAKLALSARPSSLPCRDREKQVRCVCIMCLFSHTSTITRCDCSKY